MVVMEKTRDIAILKSMGATTGSIMRIFFLQGAVIGLAGNAHGHCRGSWACAGYSKTYQFIELAGKRLSHVTLAIQVVPWTWLAIGVRPWHLPLLGNPFIPSWEGSRVAACRGPLGILG